MNTLFKNLILFLLFVAWPALALVSFYHFIIPGRILDMSFSPTDIGPGSALSSLYLMPMIGIMVVALFSIATAKFQQSFKRVLGFALYAALGILVLGIAGSLLSPFAIFAIMPLLITVPVCIFINGLILLAANRAWNAAAYLIIATVIAISAILPGRIQIADFVKGSIAFNHSTRVFYDFRQKEVLNQIDRLEDVRDAEFFAKNSTASMQTTLATMKNLTNKYVTFEKSMPDMYDCSGFSEQSFAVRCQAEKQIFLSTIHDTLTKDLDSVLSLGNQKNFIENIQGALIPDTDQWWNAYHNYLNLRVYKHIGTMADCGKISENPQPLIDTGSASSVAQTARELKEMCIQNAK